MRSKEREVLSEEQNTEPNTIKQNAYDDNPFVAAALCNSFSGP